MTNPKIAWALFCLRAYRLPNTLLAIEGVTASLPVMSQKTEITLAFGIHGQPSETATFSVHFTGPLRQESTLGPFTVKFSLDGSVDFYTVLKPLPVSEPGAYVAVFQFAGQEQPDYTTMLQVLPSPQQDVTGQTKH
jgi:hypothetical protein